MIINKLITLLHLFTDIYTMVYEIKNWLHFFCVKCKKVSYFEQYRYLHLLKKKTGASGGGARLTRPIPCTRLCKQVSFLVLKVQYRLKVDIRGGPQKSYILSPLALENISTQISKCLKYLKVVMIVKFTFINF